MPDPTPKPCQNRAAPRIHEAPAAVLAEDAAWQHILTQLPADLETSARQTHAFRRRRVLRSAGDLLRVVLLYTLVDWPFRLVAAWISTRQLTQISDVAVRQRVRQTLPWLQTLIQTTLAVAPTGVVAPQVRVRLIDATTAQRPGSTSTDWRLHLQFDLAQATIRGIEVTDAKGGETLVRHPTEPGEISVADRGYAHRRGIGAIVADGGDLVVRTTWHNLPLQEQTGHPFDLFGWLRTVPHKQAADHAV